MDMDSAYQNGTFIKDADGYMPRWQAKAQAFLAAQGLRMGRLTSDLGKSLMFFTPKVRCAVGSCPFMVAIG